MTQHRWPLRGPDADPDKTPDNGCQTCWECDLGPNHDGECDCYCTKENP